MPSEPPVDLVVRIARISHVELGEISLKRQETIEFRDTPSRMKRLRDLWLSLQRSRGYRPSRRAGVTTLRPGASRYPLSREGSHGDGTFVGRFLVNWLTAVPKVASARFGHRGRSIDFDALVNNLWFVRLCRQKMSSLGASCRSRIQPLIMARTPPDLATIVRESRFIGRAPRT